MTLLQRARRFDLNSEIEPRRGLLSHFKRDASGGAAVEFALLVGPTIMTIAAIFEIGMNYYMTTELDHATRRAARNLMTGATQTGGYTAAQVRQQICLTLPSAFSCNDLFVSITSLTAPAYISSLAQPNFQTPYYNFLNAKQSGLQLPPFDATKDAFTTSTGTGSCWLIVLQVAYPSNYFFSFLIPGAAAVYKGKSVKILTSNSTFLTEPYPKTPDASTTGC